MKHFYSELYQLVKMARLAAFHGFAIPEKNDQQLRESSQDSEQQSHDMSSAVESFLKSHELHGAQKRDTTIPIVTTQTSSKPVLMASNLDALKTLDELYAQVQHCKKCALGLSRNHAVTGNGNTRQPVMIIGDYPSPEDDLTGMAFSGGAGDYLDKWLQAVSLSRYSNVYVSTYLKCRPRDLIIPDDAWNCCEKFLQAQVRILAPRVILILGTSLANRLQMHPGFQVFQLWGTPAMATYHPSEVVRDESLKRPVWETLKAFNSMFLKSVGDSLHGR
jgi:uracil-DNA glycosylase family 4